MIVLLRRNAAQGGLPVKKLRESWSGVTNAIEELEREGRVLVTRTGKNLHAPNSGGGAEGQMKTVFLDDIGRERDPLDQGQFSRSPSSPFALSRGATLSRSLCSFDLLPARAGNSLDWTLTLPTVRLEPLSEFKDLWHSLKTPIGDELAQELQAGKCSGLLSLCYAYSNALFRECMHPFPPNLSLWPPRLPQKPIPVR